MKKIKYLLILFLMFIGINSVSAFDTSLKVYDYAQVLTPTEENSLKKDIDLFIANHSMDLVLVTVKYHEKNSTMEYADDFYDYNGFGIGSNYDGIIFVIDFTFGYTDVYMSTSGKAINIYTDSRINDIIDNVAAKKNNGYYEMFSKFIEVSNYYARQGNPSNNNASYSDSIIDWKNILIISAVLPTIIIIIFLIKNKGIKAATNAAIYLIQDSVVINKRNERFVTTHTTSVRIDDSNSSSGGRSSTHTSSSGRSHGGGGRRL